MALNQTALSFLLEDLINTLPSSDTDTDELHHCWSLFDTVCVCVCVCVRDFGADGAEWNGGVIETSFDFQK